MTGRFCAACGQEDRPLDPSLRELGFELWNSLTNVDGRVLGTVRRLFLSPGFLTRKYREGRRASWLSPVRLYLVTSLVYFGISALTNAPGFDIDVAIPDDVATRADAWLAERGLGSVADLQETIEDAEARWMPRVMILLVPLFALLVFVAKPRSGRRFPYHLVFALHVHAAWLGAFSSIAVLDSLVASSIFESALAWVAFLYPTVYVAIGLRTAYGGSRTGAVVRALLICTIYWTLAFLTTMGIRAAVLLGGS